MAIVEFLEYWHKKGKAEDDSVFRFFCYYVAFNHLFESCNQNKHSCSSHINHGVDCSNCHEKTKICALIDKYYNKFNSKFNPFDGDILHTESELIVNTVWRNAMDGEEFDAGNKEVVYGEISRWNFKNLFRNIHQVRCNLFHGAKDLQTINQRNRELVRESADVLEHFLECMIEILKH